MQHFTHSSFPHPLSLTPQISFSGPVGCAELLPGAPTNLKARPGDGSVTLTWDRPANGEAHCLGLAAMVLLCTSASSPSLPALSPPACPPPLLSPSCRRLRGHL